MALFTSANGDEGTIDFRNYGTCGNAVGVTWTATRR
jgi:hypothetical protein